MYRYNGIVCMHVDVGVPVRACEHAWVWSGLCVVVHALLYIDFGSKETDHDAMYSN